MKTSKTQLYQLGKLYNHGSLLLKSKVHSIDGEQLTLQIYEKGLMQYDTINPKSARRSIQFDFDIKYSFCLDKLQLKFQFDGITSLYNTRSESNLKSLRAVLRNCLNQRGFHEQFKAIKKIGKGNFASVYLVQKKQDKKNYAVKAFSKEAAYSEDHGKQSIMKQIKIMRQLHHKNTMKLYEVFQSQNSFYLIFELLQGGQLYDLVKEKHVFARQEIQEILRGILLGLRQMHQKKIMHRDLKPQNLLFRKEGDFDCVIADFGLSEFTYEHKYLFVRCGTPGYVAPEVINIKDYSSKYETICDMFSLGLIFYLLLLGKSAFPGTTYNDVLRQNRAARIKITQQDENRAGSQAIDLLKKMLQVDPNHRITASQALKHKYLSHCKQLQPVLIPDQVKQNCKEYPNVDSPLLTTANRKRKANKQVQKDSCIQLKIRDDNIITGKTDPVQHFGSKFTSIATETIKKVKLSAFGRINV